MANRSKAIAAAAVATALILSGSVTAPLAFAQDTTEGNLQSSDEKDAALLAAQIAAAVTKLTNPTDADVQAVVAAVINQSTASPAAKQVALAVVQVQASSVAGIGPALASAASSVAQTVAGAAVITVTNGTIAGTSPAAQAVATVVTTVATAATGIIQQAAAKGDTSLAGLKTTANGTTSTNNVITAASSTSSEYRV